MKSFQELPQKMQNRQVWQYYKKLQKKQKSLVIKRTFDAAVSSVLIVLLCPVLLIISVMIKLDSRGPVIFRQERVTQYGRRFQIYKFRTMIDHADRKGTQVTLLEDNRITRVGNKLRKYRLDELPQLFNVWLGDMSFVGTRPEVVKYVSRYSDEMWATLLMPAGITSIASIEYMDEAELLSDAEDADETYMNVILPEKMKYNLKELREFSCLSDLIVMVRTLAAVIR